MAGRFLAHESVLLFGGRSHRRHSLSDLFRRQILDMGRQRPRVAGRVFEHSGAIAVELVLYRSNLFAACSDGLSKQLVAIFNVQAQSHSGIAGL